MTLGGSHNKPDQADVAVFRKDETLDRLAETFNVAQFVSFAPAVGGPAQQFCRIAGFEANHQFESVADAIQALFERSSEGTVNVRSFSAQQSQSREFIYGVDTAAAAVTAVERMADEGAFTIVNETIDVSDGGISGVVMGDVVEFRPDMTPRGVENPGFARLPTDRAVQLFKTVYGVDVDFADGRNGRLEFSLHPRPRGWKKANVIFWEHSEDFFPTGLVKAEWPNDFSRMIGDKAYGLLIADISGFPVPRTTVIGRRVAPFSFGRATGLEEVWIRTSPREQVPGKFTTARGWQDPFALLQAEDPDGTAISSVLSQKGVAAQWSGAAIETSTGVLVVEGIKGTGDRFMVGLADPEPVPDGVLARVRDVHARLVGALGATRFEWVFDGAELWIVQLHSGASVSDGDVIVPGDAGEWVDFDVSQGLEALRSLSSSLKPDTGITLDRRIGLTSHLADVLRKARVPARVGAR
ncbi:MAG: hypothetical protein E5X48_03020 [Mesorhizobium sp.]|nr:hypothetical protein EOA64_22545 [Mesorhizobium sp. M1A.F.Ca.IN.022.02.1.1]RUV78991.1 hypothetical protein EOA50_03765 [Mesorhizobium sp. M1A.F.Ca.IN.020.30.1.1]RWG07911.1 MAG: hypothetical protein EOQ54_01295 [Mesorhizobium sp.]RWG23831.1 MAG: hypothetical protein EOQ53_02635 [Mesorhizobium sp.]RWG38199.1 MAG: hypothetical protein EOQ59_16290 [Mesorhizobium sp.]